MEKPLPFLQARIHGRSRDPAVIAVLRVIIGVLPPLPCPFPAVDFCFLYYLLQSIIALRLISDTQGLFIAKAWTTKDFDRLPSEQGCKVVQLNRSRSSQPPSIDRSSIAGKVEAIQSTYSVPLRRNESRRSEERRWGERIISNVPAGATYGTVSATRVSDK
ncbi:hypothetical protein BGZ63DRAFT_83566 [Mariannaea sp. PMI_226]|nr:hypothetical protein BGZ63DRAFT_83566 [Mariannaea sp. PMI_226]